MISMLSYYLDEASDLIDKMENITKDLISKQKIKESIEKTASQIKEQMTNLQMQLKSLQDEYHNETHAITLLESDYDLLKSQLKLSEKTLKSLKRNKDKIKLMMEDISPSIVLDDSE